MKIDTSLKKIFTSQTRLKLLTIFFYFPRELYYVRELVRATGEEINSVRRELQILKSANIVETEVRGNRVYYWANIKSPLLQQLLILANQNSGLGSELQQKRERSGQVKMYLCSYQFLLNDTYNADLIDLIIVGDASAKEIDNLVKAEEQKRKREINYMLMDKTELILRKQKRDQFMVDFFLNCPLVIIGNPKDLIEN